MSSKYSLGNEETLVEIPATEYLVNHLGYDYIHGGELTPEAGERESLKDVLLSKRLTKYLKLFNPELNDTSIYAAIKKISDVSGDSLLSKNETVHEIIVNQAAAVSQEGKSLTVKYIDYEHIEYNEFLVVRQLEVRGNQKTCFPDMIIYVNGIPIVVLECKSPFKETSSDIRVGKKDAFDQLQRYMDIRDELIEEGIPRLFYTNFFMGILNKYQAYAGTISSKYEHFLEWKDPYPMNKKDMDDIANNRQNMLLQGMFAKENLFKIMQNFILFEIDGAIKVKKLCRYQQFRAVNKVMDRLLNGKTPLEKGGVIWHTQGSGKSLTMAMLSKMIRRAKGLDDNMIVVVTDRIDLDKQIYKTFTGCFPSGYSEARSNLDKILTRAEKIDELKTLLSSGQPKIIMTTIYKFQTGEDEQEVFEDEDELDIKEQFHYDKEIEVLNNSNKIIVMTDEAHRSQYSNIAANMRHALPNATFIGFTGTPIEKRDINTYRTFGGKIDQYTLKESVADEATVAIVYEGRRQNLHVLSDELEEDFNETFADKSKEEMEAIKKKYATRQAIAEAADRIDAIAVDLLEHYRDNIFINGFKAQIVCVSRIACVKYYNALKRHMKEIMGEELEVAVIFSGGNNDIPILKVHHKTKQEQDAIISRYKSPIEKDKLCFIIVKDMLLTGFDAPIEQVMYLDRSLKEHNLLQAIARVNRTYVKETKERDDLGNPLIQKKSYGFIVDYYGITNHLTEALKVFDENDIDIDDQMKSIKKMYEQLQNYKRSALSIFAGVDQNNLDELMNILEPENKRAEFEVAFKRYAIVVDALMPNYVDKDDIDVLKWLAYIRAAAKARFEPTQTLDIADCGGKVRALISEHLKAKGVYGWIHPVTLFENDFDSKMASLGGAKAQASAMEHIIIRTISVKMGTNPVRYQSLLEKLQSIIDETVNNWEDRKTLLEEFIKRELDEGKDDDVEKYGLKDTNELAVFDAIKNFYEEGSEDLLLMDEMKDMTYDIINVVKESMVVGFNDNPARQQDMTQKLSELLYTKYFSEFGVDKIDRMVRYFVELAKINKYD
ncbi:type I restriction endonuclease subunit R [[Clostridium] fimetarium]|uniref:Type I restriction enzyme endonuclease subunit n=1 Tax=[Clostridium] fimetarium TaxID=99656 RepID=A0A1I0MXC2_9FIRM|nr:type I restriction endonuclease subunit R [[Clostridium] fimetarium]SEV93413.1 type I restriction enzyme, R subunit [[Clostridium] fimetarium]